MWDQQNFLLIFLSKLCLFFFCFICLLKTLNQKATLWKETIGIVVRIATILSYIKPRSITSISIINRLLNSTALSVVCKFSFETIVIKWNEMKWNHLKFCFLNFVAFCARTKIKAQSYKVFLDLQSFSSSTDTSIFSHEINNFCYIMKYRDRLHFNT